MPAAQGCDLLRECCDRIVEIAACNLDAQTYQICSSDVCGILLAALQELHRLAVAYGAGCALRVGLQTLIEQPLGLLQCMTLPHNIASDS